ncbi:hypothetical protein NC651_006253 [Populus alba x Populus x berolinensis]|nr:hypothetical protein NC651_006253 [Populus alba x Populus x berolinensis]
MLNGRSFSCLTYYSSSPLGIVFEMEVCLPIFFKEILSSAISKESFKCYKFDRLRLVLCLLFRGFTYTRKYVAFDLTDNLDKAQHFNCLNSQETGIVFCQGDLKGVGAHTNDEQLVTPLYFFEARILYGNGDFPVSLGTPFNGSSSGVQCRL